MQLQKKKNMTWQFSCVFLFLFIIQQVVECAKEWSHDHQEDWSLDFPDCSGDAQSPININTALVRYSPRSSLQFYAYNRPITSFTIQNNGHSIEFAYRSDQQQSSSELRPTITGSILNWKHFSLAAFHFHWGQRRGVGSEHTFNRIQYDMELHFVHFNSDRYRSLEEATGSPNGVAVVAVLFKVVPYTNPHLQPIVDLIDRYTSQYRNQTVPIRRAVYLEDLLPETFLKAKLFTYEGSLTTPPCTEGVTWLIFDNINTIGQDQISIFRAIRGSNGRQPEGNNYRELQKLNGRQVMVFKV